MNPISTTPPTYTESQREAYARTEATSIEQRGDKLLNQLRKEGMPDAYIKALMEYVITKLPETESFIPASVKHSAFDSMTKCLRDKFGYYEFEQLASNPNSIISSLCLDEDIYVYHNIFSRAEIRYIGRELLGSKLMNQLEADKTYDLTTSVFECLCATKCNMTIHDFLTRLNPDFPDDASSASDKKSKNATA